MRCDDDLRLALVVLRCLPQHCACSRQVESYCVDRWRCALNQAMCCVLAAGARWSQPLQLNPRLRIFRKYYMFRRWFVALSPPCVRIVVASFAKCRVREFVRCCVQVLFEYSRSCFSMCRESTDASTRRTAVLWGGGAERDVRTLCCTLNGRTTNKCGIRAKLGAAPSPSPPSL